MLFVDIVDETQCWVTSFNKTSEMLLDISAERYAQLKTNDESKLGEVLSNAYGKIINIKCLMNRTEYETGFQVILKNCYEDINEKKNKEGESSKKIIEKKVEKKK